MKNYTCSIYATILGTVKVPAESINEVAQKALTEALLEAQKTGNGFLRKVSICAHEETSNELELLDMKDLIAQRLCSDDDILDEDFLTEILCATVDVAREREDLSPEEIADGVLKAASDSLDD